MVINNEIWQIFASYNVETTTAGTGDITFLSDTIKLLTQKTGLKGAIPGKNM
jgi:hypothetical protein